MTPTRWPPRSAPGWPTATAPGQYRRAVAVDGKTLRGASGAQGRQVHLAVMDHATRTVLAQRQVDGAPGEVPGFRPLLADLDLAGVVVTADALQTHPDAAEFLVTGKHAHYLLVVKANQPRCWPAAPAWSGIASRSSTAPATVPGGWEIELAKVIGNCAGSCRRPCKPAEP